MVNSNDIVKNILGPQKKRGGKLDSDGDRIPNKKDCQPKNTMRQDNIANIASFGISRMNQNINDMTSLDSDLEEQYEE